MTPFFVFGGQASATTNEFINDGKIKLCHRTNSATNPYVLIEVDLNAADGNAGNSGNEPDHFGEHKGPIASSVAVAAALKKDKIDWGDIIPAIDGVHSGLNWTVDGMAILRAKCDLTEPTSVKVVKDLTPSNDSGKFNLYINNIKKVTNGQDGATSELVGIDETKDLVVKEEDGSSTDLDDYYTFIECVNLDGVVIGSGERSGSSSRSLTVDKKDIEEGDQITCTFYNTRYGRLKILKDVVNDNGGKLTYKDFSFKVNGGPTVKFDSNTSPDGKKDLKLPVGKYTIVENEENTNGYTTTYDNCKDVEVTATSTAVCTIKNDDNQSYVIVDKTVVNDNGGSAKPDDFKLTVGGNSVKDEEKYPVSPGTYKAGESNLPGYKAGSWKEDCDSDGYVTVGLGETKTCTIVNDDIAPTMKLNKIVKNTYGGDSKPKDWTLTARRVCSNGDKNPDCGFSDSGDSTTFHTAKAGAMYLLSESGPVGYTPGIWECDGGKVTGNRVVLELDKDVTCSITNYDKAPQLTLIKMVTNNSGGTQIASAWTLIAQEGSKTPVINENGTIVPDTDNLEAKTKSTNVSSGIFYTLSEKGPKGYLPLDWKCEGEGVTFLDGAVKLALGAVVTCTITNDDIAPKLTVIKKVINDNSGKALPDDFMLTVDGKPVKSGETNEFMANKSLELNETQLDGYEFVSITGDELCPYYLGGTMTLNPGDVVECTITNDDIPNPAIKVVKSGPSTSVAGAEVTYTFTVTNIGDVALMDVTVEDSITGTATYVSGDLSLDDFLDIDETWIYEAKYTIPLNQVKPVNNTVTACGYELMKVNDNLERSFTIILQHEEEQEVEKTPVCDDDSHSLTIPQVLGETTPELEVTGQNQINNLVVAMTLITSGLALGFSRKPSKYLTK